MSQYFGIFEAVFVFGLAFAFYIWQMWDLKREKAKDEAKRQAQAQSSEEVAAPESD